MARGRRPVSQQELIIGREIQEQYDHGSSWAVIAVDFDMSKSTVQRLARAYRDDCHRRAHRYQLTLFN